MKKVAIVILNYNGKTHLETYLPSVVQHAEGHDVLVVDNCSTDDSVTFLKSNYPSVKLYHNQSNGGFSKGYNDGLANIQEDYKYYILLNSDVEVTANWINPVVEKLDADFNIAGIQPKILAHHNKNQFEHAGAAGGFIDKHGYPFCRGRLFSETEKDINQYDYASEIFWATGACMFVRAEVFHELGGFDADYFAHMEEIDFCWRAKLKGYKFYYEPKSVVYHLGGGTLSYMSPRKVYLNFRNSLFTLYKNYTGNYLFFKIWYRLLLDYIALGMFIIKFDFKSAREVIRAQFHFFKGLKSLKKKRKHIQSTKSTTDLSGVYKKSIVWSFFLFGKKKFSDLKYKDITL